nr:PLD nuclease N-terminal domain-containing protein [Aeoliella straminimaris]
MGFATQVFWLWMLVECLTKEPSEGTDKIIWGLVIFFGNLPGALLYFLIRRNERIDRYGE